MGASDATQAKAKTKPPQKKERNAGEKKRRLLNAAAAEFAAKGFDGARLSSIARAANVQQALIHHYFEDKENLHSEVVREGLAVMAESAWQLLERMGPGQPVSSKKLPKSEIRAITEAFVELLLGFFASNRSLLAILGHEAGRSSARQSATKIVADTVAPVFNATVARIDMMSAKGEVRKDIDARHLVLSCVAMIAFPFQEELFVSAIWPLDWHNQEHLAARKRHIVEMILSNILPLP